MRCRSTLSLRNARCTSTYCRARWACRTPGPALAVRWAMLTVAFPQYLSSPWQPRPGEAASHPVQGRLLLPSAHGLCASSGTQKTVTCKTLNLRWHFLACHWKSKLANSPLAKSLHTNGTHNRPGSAAPALKSGAAGSCRISWQALIRGPMHSMHNPTHQRVHALDAQPQTQPNKANKEGTNRLVPPQVPRESPLTEWQPESEAARNPLGRPQAHDVYSP